MNICICGREAGYPHAADCPRPLFRCSETEMKKWYAEREAKRLLAETGYAIHDGEQRGPWKE